MTQVGEGRRHTMRQTAKRLADLHDTLQSLEAKHGCWFNAADTAHHKAITLLYEIANNLDSEITDINTRLANLETQETQG